MLPVYQQNKFFEQLARSKIQLMWKAMRICKMLYIGSKYDYQKLKIEKGKTRTKSKSYCFHHATKKIWLWKQVVAEIIKV